MRAGVDWRRAILYTHRWLGIAGGALFLLWFASGIVMIYARMPGLDPGERLRRMPELDLAAARLAPLDAVSTLDAQPVRVRVAMLGDRPVYRIAAASRGWVTLFADDGARLASLGNDDALALARQLFPENAATARHDARLVAPDQWTLQSGGFLPLHRIALGDGADTLIYLSERTGELVMSATRGERRWAYAGAVPHWLYFTALRRHGALWSRVVILLSLAGCILAASGLIWGVAQAVTASRVGHGAGVRSPYQGSMRWHHYAGLAFGLVTFTWVASGLLSMDPVDWGQGAEPTREQSDLVAGGPLRLDELTLDRLRAVHATLVSAFPVKELELVQFRSEPFVLAYRSPQQTAAERGVGYDPYAFLSPVLPFEHRMVSAIHPERGAFRRFDDESMVEAARAAMPRARLLDATWLDDYDAYYYDRSGAAPLPVLRARFDDRSETWLYLDPYRGSIARREASASRLNRWLYHGLHSLDFPFLYRRRPLWDVVVIVLCLGGILLASTSMGDGWRRVFRSLRRLTRRRDETR